MQKHEGNTQGTSSTTSKQCFECRGFGHITSKCLNRRIISLVEKGENEPTFDSYCDEDHDSEHEEVMVMREMLLLFNVC